jgi:hypothetical protein
MTDCWRAVPMKTRWGTLALLAGLALGISGASARAADRCESSCDADVTSCQDVCKTYKGKKPIVLQQCMKMCADTKKKCMERRCESESKPATPAPTVPAPGNAPAQGGAK